MLVKVKIAQHILLVKNMTEAIARMTLRVEDEPLQKHVRETSNGPESNPGMYRREKVWCGDRELLPGSRCVARRSMCCQKVNLLPGRMPERGFPSYEQ